MKFYQQIILVGISLGIGGFFVTWLTSWLQKRRELFWLKYNVYFESNNHLNIILNYIDALVGTVKRTDPHNPNILLAQLIYQRSNDIIDASNKLSSLVVAAKTLYKDKKIAASINEMENLYEKFTILFDEFGFFNQMRIYQFEDQLAQLLKQVVESKSKEILDQVKSIRNKFFEIQNLIFKELKITRKIIKN
jgi:hypothetical protein